MKNLFKNSFIPEIKNTIEEKPFQNAVCNNIFKDWCKRNSDIIPIFVSRKNWNDFENILQKKEDKYELYIPVDLGLHEVIDIVKEIEANTFQDFKNSEEKKQRVEKLTEIGVLFEKAGLYLFKYLPDLENDELANDLAKIFYDYGLSLQKKEKSDGELTDDDIDKIDKWFLGEDIYQKRIQSLGKNCTQEEKEKLRKHLLNVYFKALERNKDKVLKFKSLKQAETYFKKRDEKPFEKTGGSIMEFQNRAKGNIKKAVKIPENELYFSIFERGVKKLINNINIYDYEDLISEFLKDGFDVDIAKEKVRLYNVLNIDALKKELNEVRETGSIEEISQKELAIAKKIHIEVQKFSYQVESFFINEIIKTDTINCVGASLLGSMLLKELGIKCLHIGLPAHSSTVLITSDGSMYWQDFLVSQNTDWNFMEIQDFMFEGNNKVSQIIEDCKKSNVSVSFKEEFQFYDYFSSSVIFSNIENGLLSTILGSVAWHLAENGKIEEAKMAYRKAIEIDSSLDYAYINLGNILLDERRYNEAEILFQKAMELSPKEYYSYYSLGMVAFYKEQYDKAEIFFRKAIELNSKKILSYFRLGECLFYNDKYEEAKKNFQIFISKSHENNDNYDDDFFVDLAQARVDFLEKELGF